MGSHFFPRGGSAQVARALAGALREQGWPITLVSSSLSLPDGVGDARKFYAGLTVSAVDCTPALTAADPLRALPPLPPCYEDRPGAPDRVFAAVDDATYEHHVTAWAQVLHDAGAAEADILHLHHLTPLNEAARRVAPHVPIVGHLHGTELLMLEAIAAGPPPSWVHAAAWERRLHVWASACRCLVVPFASQVARVQNLLHVPPERIVQLPNGFEPQHFVPHAVNRPRVWRQVLVEEPRGWCPGGAPGSIAYPPDVLQAFASGPVLLYVGRFLAFKRIDLLIRAHMRARASFLTAAPLVLVGGFPGEWEGEHPFETVRRLGAQDVFLAGWHSHEELPDLYAAADAIVLPSVREQFGLVLVEGMACGLPAIANAGNHGPGEIVTDHQTGWLVPPDDEQALAAALIQAVNDPSARHHRGRAAQTAVHARYAWSAVGNQLARLYERLLETPLVA
jgi:glycosyltransferase involved in cell wall biosynthesis